MDVSPEQLADFVDRLARMETKLDQLRDDEPRTSGRLDRVERFMWLAVGLAAASSLPDVIKAGAIATAGG